MIEDYWAGKLPVNVGQDNFEEISVVYFRDETVALEAFKSDRYDYRNENSSKSWATAYGFQAVERGDVVMEEISLKNVEGMQAFAFNTRRDKFRDKRVRLAFNYAFDFEWSNANLFYGQYKRSDSYFNNSELAATGLPGPDELALLDPLRGKIPDEVFTRTTQTPSTPRRWTAARTCAWRSSSWARRDGRSGPIASWSATRARRSRWSSCLFHRCSSASFCPMSTS